jgi:hypothetical protein
MVRKEGKEVNSTLTEATEQYNVLFETIQNISHDFVQEIDQGNITKFDDFFEKYNKQVASFQEKIPVMKREIRKFGIY